MTDPRDDFRPYWPSTVAPFDTASEPPSVPARAPWQHPLLPPIARRRIGFVEGADSARAAAMVPGHGDEHSFDWKDSRLDGVGRAA
jgi:hypothetical protein